MSTEHDTLPAAHPVVERYALTWDDAVAMLHLAHRGDTRGVRALLAGLHECRTPRDMNHRRR